jgi:alkylation response protein AidB-like acyl-CoA dehydrogenase
MNFEHSEEQSLLRDMVREFAEKEGAPSAKIAEIYEGTSEVQHLVLGSGLTR